MDRKGTRGSGLGEAGEQSRRGKRRVSVVRKTRERRNQGQGQRRRSKEPRWPLSRQLLETFLYDIYTGNMLLPAIIRLRLRETSLLGRHPSHAHTRPCLRQARPVCSSCCTTPDAPDATTGCLDASAPRALTCRGSVCPPRSPTFPPISRRSQLRLSAASPRATAPPDPIYLSPLPPRPTVASAGETRSDIEQRRNQ